MKILNNFKVYYASHPEILKIISDTDIYIVWTQLDEQIDLIFLYGFVQDMIMQGKLSSEIQKSLCCSHKQKKFIKIFSAVNKKELGRLK